MCLPFFGCSEDTSFSFKLSYPTALSSEVEDRRSSREHSETGLDLTVRPASKARRDPSAEGSRAEGAACT